MTQRDIDTEGHWNGVLTVCETVVRGLTLLRSRGHLGRRRERGEWSLYNRLLTLLTHTLSHHTLSHTHTPAHTLTHSHPSHTITLSHTITPSHYHTPSHTQTSHNLSFPIPTPSLLLHPLPHTHTITHSQAHTAGWWRRDRGW